MNKRNILFDIIRGLCVLEIVGYFHMFDYTTFTKDRFGSFITIGVLAMFTFMSSYFWGQTQIIDKKKFYISRLQRFYIPFFVSLSILFAVNFIPSFKIYILSILGLSGLFPPMPRTLWYIDMLIIFYLLTPYLQSKTDNSLYKDIILRHIICFVLFLILTLFCGADNRMAIYFPFYSLGLILGPQFVQRILKRSNLIFIITCFIELLLLLFWPQPKNIYTNICYHLIVGFLGIISIIIISNYIEKMSNKHVVTIFRSLSYASMMAYMYHREIYGMIKISISPDKFPVWLIPLAIILVFLTSYYLQKIYDSILFYLKNKF